MSEEQHYETAPEDRIPVFQKIVYGIGALCNQLLPAAISCMAIVLNVGLGMNPALIGTILAIPRLIDAIIDPVMGYITDHTRSRWGRRKPYIFIGALLSGLTFALMWQLHPGRTEHFYFWFFIFASIIFYGAYTVFAAPFIALGYEMTPDYHERTSLQGYANSIGTMTWIIAPWFWWAMANKNWFADSVEGARTLAVVVGVVFAVVGILPAIFIKERFFEIATSIDKKISLAELLPLEARAKLWRSLIKFYLGLTGIFIVTGIVRKILHENIMHDFRNWAVFTGIFIFAMGTLYSLLKNENALSAGLKEVLSKFINFIKGIVVTVKNVEFLKLCAVAFAVFNGFMMISGLGSYVIIYYVFGGLQKEIVTQIPGWVSQFFGPAIAGWLTTSFGSLSSGFFIGLFGSISAVASTVIATPIVTWFSKKMGKRKAFYAAMLIAIFGYILKWFLYKPGHPWLVLWAAPFIAFALSGLFTLIGSMMADVCDMDELQNGQRREGTFGAVFWWMIKMGMAVALFLSGHIMNWTGFDVRFGDMQPAISMFSMRVYEIGISIVTLVMAILVVATYNLTETKAREVRVELEKRRGKTT